MSKSSFLSALEKGNVLLLDGAMGTMLQLAGLPAGKSPEEFCLADPGIILEIHMAYIKAGARIITTCTFGANPFKLAAGMDLFKFNKKMAEIARQAASFGEKELGHKIWVAGNIGPSGIFTKPLGTLEPAELIEGFSSQIRGLEAGGADLIFIETQFDLAEVRAAVVAAKRTCRLPIMTSMTFEKGLSLTGSTPEIFAHTMMNMGVDVIGTNCSLGPDEMLPVAKRLLRECSCPVMAEPNAGLPELINGETIFPLDPDSFAQKSLPFAEAGTQIMGGCCGTTPKHIAALAALLEHYEFRLPERPRSKGIYITSRSRLVHISDESAFVLIGERINPTGKPTLGRELQQGELGEALRYSDEQIENGADVLDVNVGAPLVDEKEVLPRLVQALVSRHLVPLSLDSSDPEAIARALPYCPGSFLVNSISGEAGKMKILGPMCRDFGAPFILLSIQGSEFPVRLSERIAILKSLLHEADGMKIPKRLILVDILALSISAEGEAGLECLKFARWCTSNGFATTIGLSNISFGLPARILLNSTFLSLAAGAGLSSCIANPCLARIRETVSAMNVLCGHDKDATRFIDEYSQWKSGEESRKKASFRAAVETLYDAVLFGDKENLPALLETELSRTQDAFEVVNKCLIPAITEVGTRYERREFFLPQLIRSAETMKLAFASLEPLLAKENLDEIRPTVVLATVEGDIHDIGKNIVALMLGNHGFKVIDAGKDVPAGDIVACALQHKAGIIGLSALMTTTMVRMKDTINLIHEKNLPIKVMVGGAAVTPAFAESIGADAYSEDAVDAVKVARQLSTGNNL